MAPTFAEVIAAKHILLTTFTKDGRPKPTAVWATPDGDRLLVVTDENSWKVKRIRNSPRVTVATCDMRGKPTSDAVEAVATLLDKSETAQIARTLNKRYGVVGWVLNLYTRLRGANDKYLPVQIVAASPA